jgi:transposase
MRAGFTKLHALVVEKMKADLFAGHLFLFLGNNPRRAKVLLFDGSGLILIVKRLDRGCLMSVADLCDAREISTEDLSRLLDGVNLRAAFAAAKAKRENRPVA